MKSKTIFTILFTLQLPEDIFQALVSALRKIPGVLDNRQNRVYELLRINHLLEDICILFW